MQKITIYHNPRCSKSREVLEILMQNGVETEIFEYLKVPLTKKKLKNLFAKLNCKPLEVIRTKELVFKQKFKGMRFTDEEWLQMLIEYPVLLERPILVSEYKAIVARPTEKAVEFIKTLK